MRRPRRQPRPPAAADPFAPIEVAVDAILALLVVAFSAGLIVIGVQAMTGHGSTSLFSFQETVCVDAAAGQIGIEGTSEDDADEFPKTSPRGSTNTDRYNVCLNHASVGEQVAASADSMLSLALVVGAGLLVRRMIRTARAVGLFTTDAARRTRELGWFIVIMSVAWPVGARAGVGVVVATAIPGQHWWTEVSNGWPLSLTLLLTGLGALSFARILRLAVPLQEAADLTV